MVKEVIEDIEDILLDTVVKLESEVIVYTKDPVVTLGQIKVRKMANQKTLIIKQMKIQFGT